MNDSQTPVKNDQVNNEKNVPAEDRQESGYYYDDSTGYEVYKDDADDESSTDSKPATNS